MLKDFIKLDDEGTYAIMAPNKLLFLYEASEEDVARELDKLEIKSTAKEAKSDCANIAFITTFDCNLNCVYCYAKGGDTKEYLPLEKAFVALDYLKTTTKCDKLNLYFVGGGEPLLNFNLVQDIVLYAEKLFGCVYLHVVSNGTFNEKTLNWLVEKDVNVRISYDCVGQSDNRRFRTGKSSAELVRNNIKKLIEKECEVIIQCVITKDTVFKMKECINDVCDLGVKYIKFEPALPTAVSRGSDDISPNPVDFANNLFDVILYVRSNNLDVKIDTAYFTKPADGYYCGMSKGNFTITPEGYIIPCVEVARKTDPYFDRLFLGNVKLDGININEDNKQFLKTLHYNNYAGGCSSCKNRLICLGGCPMANIWQGGFPLKKSKYTCLIMNQFLPKILLAISKDEKILDILIEDPEIKKEV